MVGSDISIRNELNSLHISPEWNSSGAACILVTSWIFRHL
jgi:hypothetical protein